MKALPVMFVSFLLPAGAQSTGPRVWAVSDGVRVSPVSGKVIESRPDIHKDYPAGTFRTKNLVWDSSTKTVTLKAARNEFTAFQAIIEHDKAMEDVDVTVTPLKHASGVEIGGRFVGVFKEWYVQVRRPSTGYEGTSLGADWYPDALMPARHADLRSGFPFSVPDLYNNIPGQKNHAIWFDIYVPYDRKEAPPGRYTGEVRLSWKGGQEILPLVLDVWDFALPHENHLPGDIWNGSMKNMPRREELAYYQLARRHRFLPLIYAYRPGLSVRGTNVTLDWKEFDERLAPYLDGSAFTAEHGYWGPGYGIPLDHMMLPFDIERHGNPPERVAGSIAQERPNPEYEAVWREAARQVKEHLDRDPRWRKVMKIAFLNGLDESYNEQAYEKMLYYGRLLHDVMGRDWFKYRIDGGYSREAMEKLRSEVDLWICHTVSYDRDTVEHFRGKGVEAWFYGPMIYEQQRNSGCGSNTFLDLDLLVNRAIGWVGWKYQAGWVEWEFDWNAYASWYEAENFKEPERIYNGSGQLIYRGSVMGYDTPVPSIRLKAQRRGLQDYEYFWLLANAGDREAADRIVNGIVYKQPFGKAAMLDTEIWKNDPDAWERARIAAGDLIAKQVPAGQAR